MGRTIRHAWPLAVAGGAWAFVAAACGGGNDAFPGSTGTPSADASLDAPGTTAAASDGSPTLEPTLDAQANPDASVAAGDAQRPPNGDGASDASSAWPPVSDGAPPTLPVCVGSGARYVTGAVDHHFGGGQNFGQDTFPSLILGPPKGGGSGKGSLDVVSLGDGGSVTVAFAGNAIVDVAGTDFIVFENAFDIGTPPNPDDPYAEPGAVAVSQDGVTWLSFPCTATAYPYGSCAGWHPVFANPDTNTIDPLAPAVAGGDPFDLADVGLAWARYVRVTDRPGDGLVFDLDAMAIVHPACP